MTKQASSTVKRPRLIRPRAKTLTQKQIDQIGKIASLNERVKDLEERLFDLEERYWRGMNLDEWL